MQKESQRIALERIEHLFSEADKCFAHRPGRADHYVKQARRLGMRYNVRIPAAYKLNYCRQCQCYLKLGVNARVRTRSDRQAVVFTCLKCGWIRRYGYGKPHKRI